MVLVAEIGMLMSYVKGLVSVIVPSYNRLNYIESAIQSVLEQSYHPIELIVVDDGSTDGSFEKLRVFEEKGLLKLLFHPGRENRGQSSSINAGLKQARGEYVGILDSDDLLAPGVVERHARFLSQNSDVGMVYGKGGAIDAMGQALGFDTLNEDHVEPGDPNRLLLDCYIASPGGSMIRRTVLNDAGRFEETFRAAQDHDMALRIFEISRVVYIPEVAFYYRKHGDTISANGLERRWRTGFEILRRARNRYPYRADILRKRAAVLNFRLGQALLQKKKILSAAPYLVKAGLLDPARALKVITGRESVR